MDNRLLSLLNSYRQGTLTEAGRRELAALLDSEAAAEQLDELLRHDLAAGDDLYGVPLQQTEERIVKGVLKKITATPVAPVRPLRSWRRGGWAAAAILIIAAGIWFRLSDTHPRPSLAGNGKPGANDAAPGGYKAILTLSDGTSITLDSAANGAIARQGSAAIVKLANGRIAYTGKGGAAGPVMMNTMRTPRGGQYQLSLPDGTQVWLNAASSISYPAVFTGGERRVSISGEAYFEVAQARGKPFIVQAAGKASVEVLGTHFNVNSYPNEGPVRTTLLQGSVRVRSRESGAGSQGNSQQTTDNVILRPGQQAQVSDAQLSVAGDVDIDRVMAWKNGIFNFDNAGVEEVMRQLERWYDVQVLYEKGVPNIRFEGEISRNIRLSDLLKVLSRADLKFRLEEGRRLIILP